MEIDLRDSTQLLLTTESYVRSYYLHNGSKSSEFDINHGELSGFTQLNKHNVILVAEYEHCILKWNRTRKNVSILAGECGTEGQSETLFQAPSSVIKDRRDPDYVIVTDNYLVIFINVHTGQVSSVIQVAERTTALLWVKNNLVLVSTRNQLILIEGKNGDANHTIIELSPNNGTKSYGTFSGILFNALGSLKFIHYQDWIIATDNRNKKLILLNIAIETAIPVCVADPGCKVSTEFWRQIYCTVQTNDTMYVASNGAIYKLTGKLCFITIYAFAYQNPLVVV